MDEEFWRLVEELDILDMSEEAMEEAYESYAEMVKAAIEALDDK